MFFQSLELLSMEEIISLKTADGSVLWMIWSNRETESGKRYCSLRKKKRNSIHLHCFGMMLDTIRGVLCAILVNWPLGCQNSTVTSTVIIYSKLSLEKWQSQYADWKRLCFWQSCWCIACIARQRLSTAVKHYNKSPLGVNLLKEDLGKQTKRFISMESIKTLNIS